MFLKKSLKIYFVLCCFLFAGVNNLFAQKNEEVKEEINWISFEALKDSVDANPDKKIFIEIYTDWCGPCKMMEKKVFSKKKVIKPMNESYYAVRLNSEKMDSLNFNGKNYYLTPKGKTKISELALEIGMEAGQLSYPTVIILNNKYEVIYRYPAFMNADLMEDVLETWK